MDIDIDEFYNGKALFAGLEAEDIIAYYRYDRDKVKEDEHYREISYFLTNSSLLKTVARHHSIEITKWRRDDFYKIEKFYDVKLYNTKKTTKLSKIIIYSCKEEIVLDFPTNTTGSCQVDNFFNFIKEM